MKRASSEKKAPRIIIGRDKREDQPGYYLTGQVVAAYGQLTPLADSPTRRRGKKSLLIRRDATLRFRRAGIAQLAQPSAALPGFPGGSPAHGNDQSIFRVRG